MQEMSGVFSKDGFDCPHCGADVPRGAKRCRHCGASEDCGWEESTGEYADGAYLDDDDFDYDAFVAREFGSNGTPSTTRTTNLRTLVVVAIVVALLLPIVLGLASLL